MIGCRSKFANCLGEPVGRRIEQVYDSSMSTVDTEDAQRVLEDRLADVCGQLNVHHRRPGDDRG